jgi:protein kinase A
MEGDRSRRDGNLLHGAGDVFAHPWFGEVDWDRRQITTPTFLELTVKAMS